MPAVSEKQRRFFGAELARLRAGKKTITGLDEETLREFASKPIKPKKKKGKHNGSTSRRKRRTASSRSKTKARSTKRKRTSTRKRKKSAKK